MKNSMIEILCQSVMDVESKAKSKLGNMDDFIFRGQFDSDWDLETTFQRFRRDFNIDPNFNCSKQIYESLLHEYGSLLSKLNIYSSSGDFENLTSYGQHHGIPTNWLDWSESLSIALFFSLSDHLNFNVLPKYSAVYALRVENLESLVNSNDAKKVINLEGGFKIFEKFGLFLKKINDPKLNKRLVQQNALFTSHEFSFSVDLSLNHFFENSVYDLYKFKRPILYKFIFPTKDGLRNLKEFKSKYGSCFSSLFPDNEGCALDAKLKVMHLYKDKMF